MIQIKNFVFNSFQVNTFLLFDESKECIIIDAACYDKSEREQLSDFISKNELKPMKLLTTHCHVDHILGNAYVMQTYKDLSFETDEKSSSFIKNASGYASVFDLNIDEIPKPTKYIKEGDIVHFGHSTLTVISTPGHADGSLSFYNKEQKFVIVGDVLFCGSIGRTDLPTGDYDLLMKSIQKLLVLGDDVEVLCGHGPITTIGNERRTNCFLND